MALREMSASKLNKDHETRFELGDVKERLKGSSMYTFEGGIETLSRSMVEWLSKQANVTMLTETAVKSIKPETDGLRVSRGHDLASELVSQCLLSIEQVDCLCKP
jgi:hypothetical protein